jgi:hypothetical protein
MQTFVSTFKKSRSGVTGAETSGMERLMIPSFHLLHVTPKQDVVISLSSAQRDAKVMLSNLQEPSEACWLFTVKSKS